MTEAKGVCYGHPYVTGYFYEVGVHVFAFL